MTPRRAVLGSMAALGTAALFPSLPRLARAASAAGNGRKFLFVFNSGGWDPLCVFAPLFDSGMVDMQPGADLATIGGIPIVDHGDRPLVRSFFERWHASTLVVNGVSVPSVSHEGCTTLAMTGGTSLDAPDWPALLAADAQAAYTLPHLVLSGPSFPGDYGAAVTRSGTNGQLQSLLDGGVFEMSDQPVGRLPQPQERIIDRYLARRAAARADAGRSEVEDRLATAFAEATTRAQALKDRVYDIDLSRASDFNGRVAVAVRALSLGLSRCVTLTTDGSWDSHISNDANQSPLYESLFLGLDGLMGLLESTPGTEGGSLAQEVVVVVLSEMGRTPLLNGAQGRDHWPYTTMMLLGPGLTTDRVVGGHDEAYFGLGLDPDTAIASAEAPPLTADAVGATLVLLAAADPAELLPEATPIRGVLA